MRASLRYRPVVRLGPVEPPPRDDEPLDYRALFTKSPWPIFVVDKATFRILAFNEAALQRYGYSRDELLAMRATDLRPREEVAEFTASFRREGQSGDGGPSRVARTWHHRTKDGTVFDVDVWHMNLTYGGKAAQMALVQDVTTRVRMEEQLRQAQKMEAVGLLAGGIAHDFNNFLSIILGSVQVAERALASGGVEEVAESLRTIGDATTRAADVTHRLLAFSRKQVLRTETLDLNEVVSEFARLIARVVGEDVSLDVRPAPGRVLARADRAQVEQVLLNLCTNARQAMPTGGRLTIETCTAEVDDAFVAEHPWARAGDFAEIRVTDSGSGMAPQTLARIFEPFYTTREHGTGLGMAVVYGVVQQHGGSIGVESSPGAGTTVRVLWPLLAGDEAPAHGAGSPSEPAGATPTETILLVEDEPALRRLIARWLTGLGYEVLLAEDGEAAVRIFSERHADIALSLIDVVMPNLSGPDAFERMRSLDASARAVFMSGYSPDAARLDRIGPEHVLLGKPFDLNRLARTVRESLSAPRRPAG
jgi:two-component system cell cycle sensor histidine kinase/response regulator CckA